MTHLIADRRLYVTVDRDQVVEEGDPNGAWLLYAVGRVIGAGDVKRFDMEEDDFGRVVYDGCPRLRPPEAKVIEELQEDEDGEGATGRVLKFGGDKAAEEEEITGTIDGSGLVEPTDADDSDRNRPVPEWPGRTSPEKYIELYPTGPKAELANEIIAAKNDGAGGAT